MKVLKISRVSKRKSGAKCSKEEDGMKRRSYLGSERT
jgi:hypothetical protein